MASQSTPVPTTSTNGLATWLTGKKTFIVAFVIGVFNVALQVGLIHLSPATVNTVNAILAALGLGALRSAVNTAVAQLNR